MLNVPVMTRGQAADAGHAKYYTGRPCIRGHDTLRYVTSGICIACHAVYQREYARRSNTAAIARATGKVVVTIGRDAAPVLMTPDEAAMLKLTADMIVDARVKP